MVRYLDFSLKCKFQLLKDKISVLTFIYLVEVTVDFKILYQGLRVCTGVSRSWLILLGQSYSSLSLKK